MFNLFKRRGKKEDSYQTNEDWIKGLESPPDNTAIIELRGLLVKGLKPVLSKYVDRELDQFVEDIAQDSLLKILDNIHMFRGESKFTTWAMKIAVREGLNELRRKRYSDISLEDLKSGGNNNENQSLDFSNNQTTPEQHAHESHLMEIMMSIINEELTDKQKIAVKAILINGLPPSVVSEQLGTNRNALYKLIHDARLKIKNRFITEGINPDHMLNKM